MTPRRQLRVEIRADVDRATRDMGRFRRGIEETTESVKGLALSGNRSRQIMEDLFKVFMVWKVTEAVDKLDSLRHQIGQVGQEGMKLYTSIEGTFTRLGVVYGRGLKDWRYYEKEWRRGMWEWGLTMEEMAGQIKDVVETGGEWFLPFLHGGVLALKEIYGVGYETTFSLYKLSEAFWGTAEGMTDVVGVAMELVEKFRAPKAFVPAVIEGTIELFKLQRFLGLSREQALQMSEGMAKAAMAMYQFTGDVREAVKAITGVQREVWDFQKQIKMFYLGIEEFPTDQIVMMVRAFGDLGTAMRILGDLQRAPLRGWRELTEYMMKLPPGMWGRERVYFLLTRAFPEMQEPLFYLTYRTEAFAKALEEAGVKGMDWGGALNLMRRQIMGTVEGQEKLVEVARETKQWVEAEGAVGRYRRALELLQRQYLATAQALEFLYKKMGIFSGLIRTLQGQLMAFKEYGVRGLLTGLGPIGDIIAGVLDAIQVIMGPAIMAYYGGRAILGMGRGMVGGVTRLFGRMGMGVAARGAGTAVAEAVAGAAAGAGAGLIIPYPELMARRMATAGVTGAGAAGAGAAGAGIGLGEIVGIITAATAALWTLGSATYSFVKTISGEFPKAREMMIGFATGTYGIKDALSDTLRFMKGWGREFWQTFTTPFRWIDKFLTGLFFPKLAEAKTVAERLGISEDLAGQLIKVFENLEIPLGQAIGILEASRETSLGFVKDLQEIDQTTRELTKAERLKIMGEVVEKTAARIYRWYDIQRAIEIRVAEMGKHLSGEISDIMEAAITALSPAVDLWEILREGGQITEKQLQMIIKELEESGYIIPSVFRSTENLNKTLEKTTKTMQSLNEAMFTPGLGRGLYSYAEVKGRIERARQEEREKLTTSLIEERTILGKMVDSLEILKQVILEAADNVAGATKSQKVEVVVNGDEFRRAITYRTKQEIREAGYRLPSVGRA